MTPLIRIVAVIIALGAFNATVLPSPKQQSQANDPYPLIETASTLYHQQKFEEALAKCSEASKLNPKDYRPRALAGFIYEAQYKFKSASEAFADAIRLKPDVREIYLAKAEADNFRNAHEEAVAAARKATEIAPDYAEAFSVLGYLLQYSDKERAEAISALQTAIKLKPTLPQPYNVLGQLFLESKDEKRAEETFRKGMEVDPNHVAGRFALGRLLVKQGKLAEARQLWNGRTSDADNIHPQFIQLLTRAENLKHATDALAQKPNDPDALVDMGLAVMDGDNWVVDGRQKRALVYFQKALQRKPNFARAQYGIVKAYIQGVGPNDETKIIDRELAKLRRLDPKLAAEMDEYRKTYVSGLVADPSVKVDQ